MTEVNIRVGDNQAAVAGGDDELGAVARAESHEQAALVLAYLGGEVSQ